MVEKIIPSGVGYGIDGEKIQMIFVFLFYFLFPYSALSGINCCPYVTGIKRCMMGRLAFSSKCLLFEEKNEE